MSKYFRRWNIDQTLLLPPSVQDFVPKGHVSRFIVELVRESLDLKEIIREQILLNLPEQVFCTPDCKGLCPKCGANRNLIDCNCNETEIDPRWAALKNLR